MEETTQTQETPQEAPQDTSQEATAQTSEETTSTEPKPAAPQPELQNWWGLISFPGKERYSLGDNGALNVTHNGRERTIATLTTGNHDATYKQLSDKYAELNNKVNEVSTEWDAAEDKTKLAGRVERLRENILHANAIGDLDLLAGKVSVWDKELQEISEANYELKKQLVVKAEQLSGSEHFKEGTNAYKELIEECKKIGFTDRQRSDELWAKIEAAKDIFHERKRKHNEETEKDMLQNLDLKLELVEKAEALTNSEEWKKTAEIYKELFEKWKAIGPTMHDKNEELWNRFNGAKGHFFDRKRAHGEEIHKEHEANYALKLAIVEKAEALKDSTEWNATTDALNALMEEWKKTGRISKEKGDELWNRFNAAKDHFYTAKKSHFGAKMVELENNLIQKQALLQRANALKNSTNWRDTTEEMQELMEEWKAIGPVPRKVSDDLWAEFNGARKHFFKRKDENREKHKEYAVKKQGQRLIEMHNFLAKLKEEYADEEAKIAEFTEGLENITPGKKEKELREHLTNLIAEIQQGLESKQQKIDKVAKELEELEKSS